MATLKNKNENFLWSCKILKHKENKICEYWTSYAKELSKYENALANKIFQEIEIYQCKMIFY